MHRTMTFATGALLATLLTSNAHADVVGDRVVLVQGTNGCPAGEVGFQRLHQSPDGTSRLEATEFQVPAGKYLEVTNVEYSLPHWTGYAIGYQQSLGIFGRQRAGASSIAIFTATFANSNLLEIDERGNAVGAGSFVAQNSATHVVAFPVGPLVGTALRVCAKSEAGFWVHDGRVQIRGRLVTADPTFLPPPGSTAR
ncbi:MAG: hypothetical protein ACKV2T_17560 [Kofleriaceae bacterium]